jgi:hypothetical protein
MESDSGARNHSNCSPLAAFAKLAGGCLVESSIGELPLSNATTTRKRRQPTSEDVNH